MVRLSTGRRICELAIGEDLREEAIALPSHRLWVCTPVSHSLSPWLEVQIRCFSDVHGEDVFFACLPLADQLRGQCEQDCVMSRILGFVIPPDLSLLIQAPRLLILDLWDRQRPRGFGPAPSQQPQVGKQRALRAREQGTKQACTSLTISALHTYIHQTQPPSSCPRPSSLSPIAA